MGRLVLMADAPVQVLFLGYIYSVLVLSKNGLLGPPRTVISFHDRLCAILGLNKDVTWASAVRIMTAAGGERFIVRFRGTQGSSRVVRLLRGSMSAYGGGGVIVDYHLLA